MDLKVHTTDSAPAASQALLDGIADDLGFVPNMAAVIAESPALLAGFDGLRRALRSAALDPVLRETAGLAVGIAVDNEYGVAFHSTVLAGLGVDEHEITRMRSGDEPTDRRAAAVYSLARQVVLSRGKTADAVLQHASDEGLATTDVLEIVAECTFAGLVGTMDNLAGRVALDDALSPRAWTTEDLSHSSEPLR
jgi:alkylhydroperoxidase family enzyme